MHHVHGFFKVFLVIMMVTSDGVGAKMATIPDNNCDHNNSAAILNMTQTTDQTKEGRSLISQDEGRKKEEGMMTRIMPFMIVPFMISTGIIPMMLVSLKIMMLKSAFTGILAVILLILNLFRSRSSGQGGVFNHSVNERDMPMSVAHYGYSGDEEYGAYINRRKRDLRFQS